ncbi:MAG: glycosyltransferase 87 family protein [Candidatus Shapirobacteria bacterium]|jgi:hypothetical protein
MSKPWLIFLITIALFLRFFLMAFCYHPDLAGQSLSTYFWGFKNVTNVYDHLLSLPPTHPLVKNFGISDIFIYPPLTYFTLGTFEKVFGFTGLGQFLETLMSGANVYQISNLNLYLFLLKLPYLFFDLAVVYLLYRYFDQPQNKRLSALLWLFNPVTLYATFAMGVFDIIPVFFTVLSLYLLKNKHLLWASLSIGFGIAFKMYPIFLLPFLIAPAKNLSTKIKIIVVGFLPLILTNLPYIFSSAYRYMVFSPKSQKMLFMQWPLSGSEGIFPFIFILTFLYLLASSLKSFRPIKAYYLAFFLILFSVTHYHPQWFIWGAPFLIIEFISHRLRHPWLYLGLFLIYVFIVFTFENSLSIGLFAPLNPSLAQFVGTANLLSQKINLDQTKSLFRSVFAGISLYLTYVNLKKIDVQK